MLSYNLVVGACHLSVSIMLSVHAPAHFDTNLHSQFCWGYILELNCWVIELCQTFWESTKLFSKAFSISIKQCSLTGPHPHHSFFKLVQYMMLSSHDFDLHIPIAGDAEHLFLSSLATHVFSSQECQFKSFTHFSWALLLFIIELEKWFYILWIGIP